MPSIWNLLRHHRVGQKVAAGGNEIKGVVTRQGLNPKTITVTAWWKHYNHIYKIYKKSSSHYQVHDEQNFCRIGDVVVIKACHKLSPTKAYFVRNVLSQAARFDSWDNIGQTASDVATQKFYKVEGKPVPKDSFRLQAMKDSLMRIKSAGLFDVETPK